MIGTNNPNEILVELKRMNKFLALMAVQGKSQPEKIALLNQMDLGPKEISGLLGITPNAVSLVLHGIKKKKK